MLSTLIFTFAMVVASLAAPADKEIKDQGQIWAVLVAGSSGYGNYRHQADVCHAYQIFRRHGIPDSNIIVMMYDDIARNTENPRKGVIINKPKGPNVYKHVLKDYTGTDVTPENFVNVLTGNKQAMLGKGSGKVLQSGPNDHVFVNFVDHGATGIIGFPNDVMYASDLIKALKTMHKKKMYKKLVFYMEACESGSMFDKILPRNINIFATTAANPDESSYACYWDETVEAYLGDEYSIAWMEDVDTEDHFKNITSETLLIQFNNVVLRVNDSHPSMYGKKAIDKDIVTDYVGVSNKSAQGSVERFTDTVSSRDVAVRVLEKKIEKTEDKDEKYKLIRKKDTLLEGRRAIDMLFSRTLGRINQDFQRDITDSRSPVTEDMMPCYKTVVSFFNNHCVNITKNTFVLAHLYKLANLCSHKVSADDIIKVLSEECTEQHRAMQGID